MKPLFDFANIDKLSDGQLLFQCENCNKHFIIIRKDVVSIINGVKCNIRGRFCSLRCSANTRIKRQDVNCKNCNNIFKKQAKDIKRTNGNNFCSRSCSTTYNNLYGNKTGNRRSKLEKWIETELDKCYPNLIIQYCDKTAINSELDIYIPTLKLAFELNGIFHYKPIHGNKKFEQIKNNDNRKIIACDVAKIKLISINASELNHFKESNCQKYLTIIKNVIAENGVLETQPN